MWEVGGGRGKAFPLPTPFRFGSQSLFFFFFLFAVGPSVRPSIPGVPGGGLQEAYLDIHLLWVRKFRILFLRTLSR